MCAYAFGAARGGMVVLASLILGGVLFSQVAPSIFQSYLVFIGYGVVLVVLPTGLGLAAGTMFKFKMYWLAMLFLLPIPYFAWKTHSTESVQEQETERAIEFISNNNKIAQLVGSPYKVFLVSYTSYTGDKMSGSYQFSITGSATLNVVVNVARQSTFTTFSIACATKIPVDPKNVDQHNCSPLPLNK